jgi:uncharacterized paraquat-inducible protein A
MNVTFACPECDLTSRHNIEPANEQVICTSCQHVVVSSMPSKPLESIDRCFTCGCDELYVRKDFSQRLGLMIVIAAIVLSSIAWGYHWRYTSYGILFLAALIDVILYFSVGNLLQCYRCRAEYRGLPGLDQGEPFSLETHEKFRQQAARLAEADSSDEDVARSSIPPV